MKNSHFLSGLILVFAFFFTTKANSQSIPTVAEVKTFLNSNHFLVTYREGEAVYGTYYFIDIHYCSSGLYGLLGKSVKQTVLGNEQRNSWEEYGNWNVIEYNGNVGVYYKPANAPERFYPVYRLPNGNLSTGEGISIVKQGKAICN
ncbi:MAG TPA: hypothetical protein PKC72_11205 [Chitinophagaceae bacterium]|nr:hypothetical protein [Chitinophagaceae bacterium]